MATPARLERATWRLEVTCSIQLSYGAIRTVGYTVCSQAVKFWFFGKAFETGRQPISGSTCRCGHT